MVKKLHVKKGDEVIVIAGADKGKRGRVLAAFPKEEKVIVEGVRVVTHFVRKSAQHPGGGLVKKEAPIHVSNVMLVSEYEARRARRAARTQQTAQQTKVSQAS